MTAQDRLLFAVSVLLKGRSISRQTLQRMTGSSIATAKRDIQKLREHLPVESQWVEGVVELQLKQKPLELRAG